MKFPFTSQSAMKLAGRIAENGLTTKNVCEYADVSVQSFRLYKKGDTRMAVDAENALTLAIDALSNEGDAK